MFDARFGEHEARALVYQPDSHYHCIYRLTAFDLAVATRSKLRSLETAVIAFIDMETHGPEHTM